jgi:hypothetical protein
MKKRDLIQTALLTIFTFGIYRLLWFFWTTTEMRHIDPHIKVRSPLLILLPQLMLMLTGIIFMVSVFVGIARTPHYCTTDSGGNYTKKLSKIEKTTCDDSNKQTGILMVISGVILVLSLLVAWPLTFLFIWSYAKAAEKVTGKGIEFGLGLIALLLIPDGVDILLFQDRYNKLSEHTVAE